MALLYSPQELTTLAEGVLYGNPPHDLRVSFLLTDSRRITFARSAVFFALKTAKNDGHKYIPDLLSKGVSCFIVSQLPENIGSDAAFILVEDTLVALQQIAVAHRKRFTCHVLGITGSNGKTIVKEWLAQLLAPGLNIVKNPRSYNSQTGVPLSVWNMDASHQLGIFEAGISKPGEMEKLEKIILPQTGIFTNIGPAHDEGFEDTESKIMEKLRLFENSSMLIYCSDHHHVERCILAWAEEHPQIKFFSWGSRISDSLRVLSSTTTDAGNFLEIEYQGKTYPFHLPFSDKASLENLLHCLAFVFCQGYYHPEIPARIMKLGPLAMRMEMKQAINNCLLINDAYSSDILSLGIALDFLAAQAPHKKKVLILSDILQSGLKPANLYDKVAALVTEKKVDILLGIGREITQHHGCFSNVNASFFSHTDDFLARYDFNNFQNMGILLKGARDFSFERISSKLQLRDHQTLLEINLDALVHNLNVYRSLLKPGTRIMAMVKAFSYGSGSFEIAGLLQFHQVDYLAVAFADEGKELRNAGITMPVVVLNPELHNLDILVKYTLEPEIYSLQLLKRMAATLEQFPAHDAGNPFFIHLKLDTGMHRLGFMEDELDTLPEILKNHPALRVASVFSHLAASDMEEFDPFTRRQIETFNRLCLKLERELGYRFLRHIANSAAISRFPEAHFDMVRAGIGLYGVDGSEKTGKLLQNVTTFKSVVSQVKTLAAGETVGYNRKALLERNTRMAIVPVGYADGLSRKLGNGVGHMLVNGKKAPTLGNISMDMCCLDVTGIDVSEGDEVVVFGQGLPVQQLAKKIDTIPYEIITGIPPRVKRIYFSE